VSKLAGLSWGANANTLQTSAIALCYSVVEYCSPVWCRSSHTKLVDTQLHNTMRLITGTLWLTPLPWLPVFANIAPPDLRRKCACAALVAKSEHHQEWPLHDDLVNHPPLRITNRKQSGPIWHQPTWSRSEGRSGSRHLWSTTH